MEACGGKADDIVKVDIFVTDIKRRAEVWKARAELFSGDFPVSTLVEVRALAAPGLLVEVEAVAILGAGGCPVGGRGLVRAQPSDRRDRVAAADVDALAGKIGRGVAAQEAPWGAGVLVLP